MITKEQLARRQNYLGGSEVAAILGMDPDRSAADVWLDKRGMLQPLKETEEIERGNLLEEPTLQWLERKLGLQFERGAERSIGHLCVHYDGLADETSAEIKSTVLNEEWGEPGTDAVPDRVLIQCQAGFAAEPRLNRCHIGVWMSEYRRLYPKNYIIERSSDIVEAILERVEEFWRICVRGGQRPADSAPHLQVLQRIRRTANKTIHIPGNYWEDLENAKVAAKIAKMHAEEAEAAFRAVMLDADAALGPAGQSAKVIKIKVKERIQAAYEYDRLDVQFNHKE